MQQLIRTLLMELGEDPEREGLRKTPERVARSLQELTAGYRTDAAGVLKEAIFNQDYPEMVVVRRIPFYSLCEHHMLPFFGTVSVAYVPDGRIVGLSKIPRLVEALAAKLQVQERLTQLIAQTFHDTLTPQGTAVVMEAQHFCMQMRGVKKEGSSMRTSAMLGSFRDDPQVRQEFLSAIQTN